MPPGGRAPQEAARQVAQRRYAEAGQQAGVEGRVVLVPVAVLVLHVDQAQPGAVFKGAVACPAEGWGWGWGLVGGWGLRPGAP